MGVNIKKYWPSSKINILNRRNVTQANVRVNKCLIYMSKPPEIQGAFYLITILTLITIQRDWHALSYNIRQTMLIHHRLILKYLLICYKEPPPSEEGSFVSSSYYLNFIGWADTQITQNVIRPTLLNKLITPNIQL